MTKDRLFEGDHITVLLQFLDKEQGRSNITQKRFKKT